MAAAPAIAQLRMYWTRPSSKGGAYEVLHTRLQANAQVPERCDEQLSRLLGPLEELKSQFGDQQQFLGDILSTREEWLATFGAHKQVLLDERLRKAQGWLDAARRILQSLGRRTARLTQPDELNALFAADPLTLKRRELVERLRELKAALTLRMATRASRLLVIRSCSACAKRTSCSRRAATSASSARATVSAATLRR
jgi:hypothetical protein